MTNVSRAASPSQGAGAQASAREGHVSPSVKAFDRARIQHCQHRRSQRPRIDAGQLRAPSRARRLGLGDLAHKRVIDEAAQSDEEFVARVKREFGLDLTL